MHGSLRAICGFCPVTLALRSEDKLQVTPHSDCGQSASLSNAPAPDPQFWFSLTRVSGRVVNCMAVGKTTAS
ncbi:hypothetical protein C8Q76DRAFT_703954 [Earliella scabrosa]|nr:hypothetical protein C8Q76DRAFT_703954 [Earliella scabrosa]